MLRCQSTEWRIVNLKLSSQCSRTSFFTSSLMPSPKGLEGGAQAKLARASLLLPELSEAPWVRGGPITSAHAALPHWHSQAFVSGASVLPMRFLPWSQLAHNQPMFRSVLVA